MDKKFLSHTDGIHCRSYGPSMTHKTNEELLLSVTEERIAWQDKN